MKTADSVFAIDANIVIRYLTQDDSELSPKADAIIEGIEDGLVTVLCEPVTLSEIVYVLRTFYKQERELICSGLEPIVKLGGFLMPDKPRYIKALELYATAVPHFGDACACAAALELCGGRLLSFDKKLSGISGIQWQEKIDA
jgi:predicted nucleic-acid-binding protein